MAGVPDVVQDHQAGLALQCNAQEAAALDRVAKVLALTGQKEVEFFLAGGQVWLATDGQPDDAIGKGGLHGKITGQGSSQHRLANATHALHADNAQGNGAIVQQRLPQPFQVCFTQDIVLRQRGEVITAGGQQALQVGALLDIQHLNDIAVASNDDRAVGAAPRATARLPVASVI